MSRGRAIGFLGNSLANLLVGAATTGYLVVVPAVVLRRFGAQLYGTWYLAFQIAAYILLLDLGSQHMVTSEAASPSPDLHAARLATAAIFVQAGLALAVLGVAVGWAELTGQPTLARLVAVLGVAAMASLLATTVRAWFGGLQRAHEPAMWLVVARAAALIGLVVALAVGSSLVTLTVAVAVPQLVVHAGLLVWARRPPSPWARPTGDAFARLARGTIPLAVWTLCGIVIAGLDIFVVRAVEPSEVGRYAVALPLLAVPLGVVTAAVSAWIPRVAHAQAERSGGGRDATLVATRVTAAVLSIGALAFVGGADELVRLWAGPGHWGSAATYLRILYLASCLRFVFLPWAILVLVGGEQRKITFAPVAEAAVNVAASVLLGLWLGALGVALGTLVGALLAAALYVRWAIPRTAAAGVTPNNLACAAMAARGPVAAAAVVAVLVVIHVPSVWRLLGTIAALALDARWLVAHRRALSMAATGRGTYSRESGLA